MTQWRNLNRRSLYCPYRPFDIRILGSGRSTLSRKASKLPERFAACQSFQQSNRRVANTVSIVSEAQVGTSAKKIMYGSKSKSNELHCILIIFTNLVAVIRPRMYDKYRVEAPKKINIQCSNPVELTDCSSPPRKRPSSPTRIRHAALKFAALLYK